MAITAAVLRDGLEQELPVAGLVPGDVGIPAILEALKKNGVSVVIMTGGNQCVTQKVAHDVGLASDRMVTGNRVDTMDDAPWLTRRSTAPSSPGSLRNKRTG